MGCFNIDFCKLVMLLAVAFLVIGLIFHLVYLCSNRDSDSNQDLYNRENAKMFFLLGIGTAIIGCCFLGCSKKGMMHHKGADYSTPMTGGSA